MIKINLATKKQSGLVGDGKGTRIGINLSIGQLKLDQFKELPIRKLIIMGAVALGANYILTTYEESSLKELEDVYGKLKAQNEKTYNDVSKFKEFEKIKKSVDGDESLIRTKLDVIRKLVVDRNDISRMLMDLSSTIPKEVWLSEFHLDKEEVSIRGSALDFNQISDFMKNLKDSAFYSSVDLKNTQQERADFGLDVANFELKVKRRQ